MTTDVTVWNEAYYPLALEDEDLAGAGTWVGHVDRGLMAGSVTGGSTYSSTGSLSKAGLAATLGFGGGFGMSIYNGGMSGSGNSTGRVICTHFFRRGMLERDLWRADLAFTYKHLSPKTVRGYQYWAIPYVRLMRRHPLAERIMYPLARARAEELGYQMGIRSKGSFSGKIVRLVGETLCYVIGTFVAQKDWSMLWQETRAENKELAS
jgi:hypothetical protein